MSVDELVRGLLTQLIDARQALVMYIQLRRGQGCVSIGENDALRDNFFALAQVIRNEGRRLRDLPERDARIAFHHAEEALSSAALCLMSGRFECDSWIAVNADKLERSLNVLNGCIRALSEHSPLEEA